MKKLYFTGMIFSFTILAGCSKDFLKSYDKRIIGTWQITDVDRVGIGGNTDNLTFRDGTFVFADDGNVTYTNTAGVVFKGTWDIDKKQIDDNERRSLQIAVVDYTTQRLLTEYYDDMNFTGTNKFKANVISTFHTYVTRFRR
jgi:hypothetical protein